MRSPTRRHGPSHTLLIGCLAFTFVGGGAATFAPDARAQRAYYYGPGPRPRARYWDDREPLYATVIALDVEGAIPVNVPRAAGQGLTGGAGFKARVGEQIRAGYGVHVTPEVGYAYDRLFASDGVSDSFSWDTYRVFGGVRLAFGRILQPVVYGHLGYGWRNTGDPSVTDAQGFAWDVGGALDLHLVPRFVIGVHVEYAEIDVQPDTPSWVAIGGHAQLLF
jgi:hypothetical protein